MTANTSSNRSTSERKIRSGSRQFVRRQRKLREQARIQYAYHHYSTTFYRSSERSRFRTPESSCIAMSVPNGGSQSAFEAEPSGVCISCSRTSSTPRQSNRHPEQFLVFGVLRFCAMNAISSAISTAYPAVRRFMNDATATRHASNNCSIEGLSSI